MSTTAATTEPPPAIPGVAHHWIDVNGVRTHYAESGSGEPLVLLHGWPQNWWSWRKIIGPLSEHYRVIAPDIRGLGWSDTPASGFTQWDLRDDLFALLDALDLDGVRLIGHDFGLVTTYLAGLEQPERFKRLVPTGGIHIWTATGVTPALFARPFHIYLLASRAAPGLVERGALPAWLMRYWHGSGGFDPEVTKQYLSLVRRPATARATHERYHHIVRHEIPWFIRHHRDLRLRVPTLHLNGELDPISIGTPDSWRLFADDMRLETVAGSGHFVAEEQPERMLERVLPFLE